MERDRGLNFLQEPVCIDTPAIKIITPQTPEPELDVAIKKPRLWPGRTKRIGGTLAFGTLFWLALNQTHKTIADSGEVAIRGSLVGGGTQMDLPPAGSAKFDTHKGVKVNIQLQKVRQDSPEALKGICKEEFSDNSITDGEEATCETKVERRIQDDLEDGIKWWALRGIGLLDLAFTAAWAYSEKDWTHVRHTMAKVTLSGAAFTAAVVAPVALLSKLTYNDNAFSHPHFNGYVQDADKVVQTARRLLKNYNGTSEQAAEWLHNLGGIQKGLEAAPQPQDTINVLVFSHTKSTPCSYNSQKDLVDGFHAQLILNAGDLSEWGLPIESNVFNNKDCTATPGDVGAEIDVTKGNHDDEAIMNKLRSYSNVARLDGSIKQGHFTINGREVDLGVLGDSDPRYTPNPLTRNQETDEEILKAAGEKLADTYLKDPAKVQVVMTNDSLELEAFFAKLDRLGVTDDLPFGVTSAPDGVTRLVGNILDVGDFGNGLSGFETSNKVPGGTPISFAYLQINIDTKKIEVLYSIDLDRTTGQLNMDPVPLDAKSAPVTTTTQELVSSGAH